MNRNKHFILNLIITVSVASTSCLLSSSCTYLKAIPKGSKVNYQFTGNWQGNGVDSEGNEFAFAAKVSCLANNKYRVVILDKLNTQKEPMHIMEGVLNNNKFTYTADDGLYEGGGELSKDVFEGYYKGPVNGTYKMWRIE